jgi:hypothetical protein
MGLIAMNIRFDDLFNEDLAKLVSPDVIIPVRAILATPYLKPNEGLLAVEKYLQCFRQSLRHEYDYLDKYPMRYVQKLGNGVEFYSPDKHYALGYYYLNTGESYDSTLIFSTISDVYYVTSWGAIAETFQDVDDDLYDLEYTED